MKNNDFDIDDIINRLTEVHITQSELHQEEQELTRRLIVATQNKRLSFEPAKWTNRIKGRAIVGGVSSIQRNSIVEDKNIGAGEQDHPRDNGGIGDTAVCAQEKKTDRYGNNLKVGDQVEFLTDGLYRSRYWKIYKLTDKRVLCKRKRITEDALRVPQH